MPNEAGMVGTGTIIAAVGLRLPTEIVMNTQYFYVSDTMNGQILR